MLKSNGPENEKVPDGSYLHFIEKAQQNPSIHMCATVVFARAWPFKLLRSAQIKWARKGKSCIWVLSTFHRKGSTKSEHACVRYGRFFVHVRLFKLLRSAQIQWARK